MTDDLTPLFLRFRDCGDPNALADVFDRVALDLLRIGRHLLRDEAAAEDVVQQTFVTAIERAKAFRDDAALRPWLCGILFRHARNEWRRRARPPVAVSLDNTPFDAARLAEASEIRAAIESAVATLGAPYREVIQANLLAEATGPEIAEQLGRTRGLVRLQLHRGLRFVRGLLPRGLVAWAPISAPSLREPRGLTALRDALLSSGTRSTLAPSTAGTLAMSVTGKKFVAASLALILLLSVVALFETRTSSGDGARAARSPVREIAANRDNASAPTSPLFDAPVDREEIPATMAPATIERTIVGRVVGSGRFPVASAAVEARVAGVPIASAVTDRKGVFLVELPITAPNSVVLHVFTPDGRCVAKLRTLPPTGECDAGTIVLEGGGRLRVMVTAEGTPVGGVVVDLDRRPGLRVATGRTNPAGVVSFEHLPSGTIDLVARAQGGEAFGRAVIPEESDALLAIDPGQDYEVSVRDAETKRPIPDAIVGLSRGIHGSGGLEFDTGGDDRLFRIDGDYLMNIPAPGMETRADAAGRVVFRSLSKAGNYSWIARAPGFVPVGDGPKVDPSVRSYTIELRPSSRRTVRFPVEAGDSPIPRAATPLALSTLPGHTRGPSAERNTLGMMGNGEIVVEDVEGPAVLEARTPEGGAAILEVEDGSIEGRPTQFTRLRKVKVHVVDADGIPLKSASIQARCVRQPLGARVPLDLAGRATLVGLSPFVSTQIYLCMETADGRVDERRIASLEPRTGDRDLEYSLPRTSRVRLRLHRDGKLELPSSYDVKAIGRVCRVIAEDPEKGELLVEFDIEARGASASEIEVEYPRPANPDLVRIDVDARAIRGSVHAVPATGGEVPVVDVELISEFGTLDVVVDRARGARIGIRVDRFDAEKGEYAPFEPRDGSGNRDPNGPGDTFRFDCVRPGRYRAMDTVSGAVSDAMEITAGMTSRAKLTIPK